MPRSHRWGKKPVADVDNKPQIQMIERYFRDFDLLEPSGKIAMSRKSAMRIYQVNFLVDVNGEAKLGGLDDIEVFDQDLGGDKERDEDEMDTSEDDSHQKAHMFRGFLEITRISELSPRGIEMISEAGGDPSVLRKGGKIYVGLICQYHKYQLSGLAAERMAYITSTNGDPDDPLYHVFLVSTYSAFAIRCSIRTHERKWWLEFIRERCDEEPSRPKRQRTVEWVVDCYVGRHPHQQSGVTPASVGPQKHTHRAEAYRALGRHARYLRKALNGMSPRIVEPDFLKILGQEYEHFNKRGVLDRTKVPDIDVVESDDEKQVENEPSLQPMLYSGLEEDEDLKLFDQDDNRLMTPDTKPINNATEQHSPRLFGKTVEHTPVLSAAYTYTCPFDALHVNYHSRDVILACPFHVNLIKPSREFLAALPQWEQNMVLNRRFSRNDPAIEKAFSTILKEHFMLHMKARSRITYGSGDCVTEWYRG
ncbi:hypothetical protein FRC02_002345 [Tulasnella sp. 418]|nr:hypothetical protein FRC02_002345 [Tulasnella sp. 418]